MKYFRTNRGWKVLFIGATAPWGRLIGQVGRGVITPGERQPGHLETDFDQLFSVVLFVKKFSMEYSPICIGFKGINISFITYFIKKL